MKTYQVTTLTKTELVEAASVDESDLHVVRFIQANGRARSFGRGSLISYDSVEREDNARLGMPQAPVAGT